MDFSQIQFGFRDWRVPAQQKWLSTINESSEDPWRGERQKLFEMQMNWPTKMSYMVESEDDQSRWVKRYGSWAD